MNAKPVFISYSHTNTAIVNRLKADLLASNIPLWLDHESLTPGTPNWGLAIERGIQSSQAVIYTTAFHQLLKHLSSNTNPQPGNPPQTIYQQPKQLSSSKLLHILTGHTGPASSVAWSPDSKRLATGGWNHTAHIWDAQTGQPLLTLTSHTSVVTSVAWSPDSNYLATASHDDTARIWELT